MRVVGQAAVDDLDREAAGRSAVQQVHEGAQRPEARIALTGSAEA